MNPELLRMLQAGRMRQGVGGMALNPVRQMQNRPQMQASPQAQQMAAQRMQQIRQAQMAQQMPQRRLAGPSNAGFLTHLIQMLASLPEDTTASVEIDVKDRPEILDAWKKRMENMKTAAKKTKPKSGQMRT